MVAMEAIDLIEQFVHDTNFKKPHLIERDEQLISIKNRYSNFYLEIWIMNDTVYSRIVTYRKIKEDFLIEEDDTFIRFFTVSGTRKHASLYDSNLCNIIQRMVHKFASTRGEKWEAFTKKAFNQANWEDLGSVTRKEYKDLWDLI